MHKYQKNCQMTENVVLAVKIGDCNLSELRRTYMYFSDVSKIFHCTVQCATVHL